MRILGCREEKNMQKNTEDYRLKWKRQKRGSTYTLSVPSQEKGGYMHFGKVSTLKNNDFRYCFFDFSWF